MQKPVEDCFRFEVPDHERSRTDFSSVVMRRLRKRDEREAVQWAYEFATPDQRMQIMVMIAFEQDEKVKLSVCSIDDEPVQHPLADSGDWTVRSWEYLRSWYADVNGGDPDAIKKSVATRVLLQTGNPPSESDAATGEADSTRPRVRRSGSGGTQG